MEELYDSAPVWNEVPKYPVDVDGGHSLRCLGKIASSNLKPLRAPEAEYARLKRLLAGHP